MAQRTAQLEAVDERGCGVRAVFEWSGDRFAHTLLSLRGREAMPLLGSVEGDADQTGPPSPAFQDLSELGGDGDGVESLLLTGKSGLSHWSVSVSPETHGFFHCLTFDVAVRLKEQPMQLGSAYDATPGALWVGGEPFAIVARPNTRHALAIYRDIGGVWTLSPLRLEPGQPARRLFEPQLPDDLALPGTVRWQYAIGPANT